MDTTEYYIGFTLAIFVGIFIPFLWIFGFAEMILHLKFGKPAYHDDRYDNAFVAGFMRFNEFVAYFMVIILAIFIVLGLVMALVAI